MEQGNGSKEQRSFKNMRLSHLDVKSLLQLQGVNSLQPSSQQQPLQGKHPSALIPFHVDRKFVLLSRTDSRVSSASQRLSWPCRTYFYDVLDHKYLVRVGSSFVKRLVIVLGRESWVACRRGFQTINPGLLLVRNPPQP